MSDILPQAALIFLAWVILLAISDRQPSFFASVQIGVPEVVSGRNFLIGRRAWSTFSWIWGAACANSFNHPSRERPSLQLIQGYPYVVSSDSSMPGPEGLS